MTFQDQLLKLRKENNLSQEELAEKLGVSRQAISKWETGTSSPELANLQALCELFGVSPNEMLGYEIGPSSTTESEGNSMPMWCKVLFIILAALLFTMIITKGLFVVLHSVDYDKGTVATAQEDPTLLCDAEFVSIDSMGSSDNIHHFRLVFMTEDVYKTENVLVSVYNRDDGKFNEYNVKKNGPYYVAEIPICFRSNVIISACYIEDDEIIIGRELIQISDVTENGYSYNLR